MMNTSAPTADTQIFKLLEQTLANLDRSGEEEAAIYVNNALEVLKTKYQMRSLSPE